MGARSQFLLASMRHALLVLTLLLTLASWGQGKQIGTMSLINSGPASRAGVALGSLQTLGIQLSTAGITVRDGETPLPVQLSGDLLAVQSPELQAGEKRTLTVYAGATTAAIAKPLRHAEDQAAWMTLGDNVNLRFDKKQHGITSFQLGGEAFGASLALDVWVFPPTTDKLDSPWRFAQPHVAKDAGDFTLETLAAGPLATQYRTTWSCPEAKITQLYSYCAGDNVLRVDVWAEIRQPVDHLIFNYRNPYEFDLPAVRFFPNGDRKIGGYDSYKALHFGQYAPLPGYVLGWSPKKGGLGFAVLDRGLFDRAIYACRSPRDLSWWGERTPRSGEVGAEFFLTAQSPSLLQVAPGTLLHSTVYVFTAAKPEEGEEVLYRATRPLSLIRQGTALPPAIPPDVPPVAIERVWPNKVLYANNEPAWCDVTLRNWGDAPTAVTLRSTLSSDLDHREPLDTRQVPLQPRERKVVRIDWNTGKRLYGHELRCTVTLDGKEVDSASEYFNIASDWVPIMQDGGSRWCYQNVVRVHNEQDENGVLVAGDYQFRPRVPRIGSDWESFHKTYVGDGAQFHALVNQYKADGIKPMFYIFAAATPYKDVFFHRDPSKVLYTEEGNPSIDQDINANIYLPEFRDWLAENMIKSIGAIGWDGCFLDVSQAPPWYSYLYRNDKGKPAGAALGPDPDSAGAAFYKELLERVHAKFPAFEFAHNPEVFKSEFQYPKCYTAAGDMAMIEIGGGGASVTEKTSNYGQWEPLLNTFNSIRATKRRYGVEKVRSYILTMAPMGGEICAKTMSALCFACQFGTGSPNPPDGSVYAEPLRQYLQFGGARYSGLIYHPATRWINPPDLPVALKA
ncbi:MAG TPA: hypothetical protein VGM23_00375, partial [Armatimonadota bacterium]